MARTAMAQAEICRLRRDIARMEGRLAEADRLTLHSDGRPAVDISPPYAGAGLPRHRSRKRLELGIAALDAMLGGGLPLATLHEIRAGESRDGGMAAGFVLALVALFAAGGGAPRVVWVSEAEVRGETGELHAPGLLSLGLDPGSVVEVAARTEEEALWAFEAALVCRGLSVAICELRQASLDLSVTRRCALRARETGVTGFFLRLGSEAEPSAAELRFQLLPVQAGTINRFAAGIGRMAWRLALEKNRAGPTGTFMVEWNAHERSFAEGGEKSRRTYPQSLSAASLDRSPYPAGTERGGRTLPGSGLRYAS